MRLADEPAIHARLAQMIAQRVLTDPQRKIVPGRAMARYIAAGVEAHAAGTANRRLHISVGKAHTHRRNPIEIRCLQMRMTSTAQIIEPQLVIHNK